MKTLIAILALLAAWVGYYIYQADKVSFLRSNAGAGDPDAQYRLGQLYLSGGVSILQDFEESAKWYRKAADQGHAEAQSSLGVLYGYGWGVPQDLAESAKWWRKAAEQGDPNAQNRLGEKYAEGEGVPKDYVEAVKWYRKAADQGWIGAQSALGSMYLKGAGVPKDDVEAWAWFSGTVTSDNDRKKLLKLWETLTGEQKARAYQRSIELRKEIEAKIAAKKAVK